MTDVGVEVGQKMRLAIKAKLTELNCYVDDELPDYIMVMIANKRTKSQMKEDLNLFLSSETSFFVEWLHIVLKKLKQVHVTNPNVFKNPIKRKSNEFTISQEDYKKIKREESKMKKEKIDIIHSSSIEEHVKSLTDDLPISANSLSAAGKRKIVLFEDPNQETQEDDYDIPLVSEINASNEEELDILERKIKTVKSRLGLQVESDREDDNQEDKDFLKIKADPGEIEFTEDFSKSPPPRRIISSHRTTQRTERCVQSQPLQPEETSSKSREILSALEKQLEMKRSIHARITFDKEKDSLKTKFDSIMNKQMNRQKSPSRNDIDSGRKRSIRDRLGRRLERSEKETKSIRHESHHTSVQSKVIRPMKEKHIEKKVSSTFLGHVGVLSTVSIPFKKSKDIGRQEVRQTRVTRIENQKDSDREVESDRLLKNVSSVVKIKARVIPEKTKQANPSLLFKAVAEAQRSVSQTPAVGKAREKETKSIKVTTLNKNIKSDEIDQLDEEGLDKTEEKANAGPALFTKKYKEKMAAVKKSEENLNALDGKRSIIINRTRKAKLLEDEKLKLRFMLTQPDAVETKRVLKQPIPNETNDVDFDETKSNSSVRSDESSRTPELPSNVNLEEKAIFMQSKITVENKADDSVQIHIDDFDTSETHEGPEDDSKSNHKFIVTLDGIDKLNFAHVDNSGGKGIKFPEKCSDVKVAVVKKMIKTKRSPSPIVFEETSKPVVAVAPTKSKPAVLTPKLITTKKVDKPMMSSYIGTLSGANVIGKMMKIKEKCKYFPNCRLGDQCEFLHPNMCKMFPNCKFADQCLYAHPVCKFEASCTKKNCPFSHGASNQSSGFVAGIQSICKYYPNCSNSHCQFHHPKMCKYGMHCKNVLCAFQHPQQSGGKMTWRLVK